jgi:adenylate cyclase
MARMREERGLEVKIRIGVASGPVMAGVIGRQKFSYDVWGDAVNLAARLEGASLPGRILVCPRCRGALEGAFELENRGTVDIKGMGQQEAWYLVSVRSGDAPRSAAAE